MPRTVTLSNGQVVTDVPDDVTDEQLEDTLQSRQKVQEESQPEEVQPTVREQPPEEEGGFSNSLPVRAIRGASNFVGSVAEEAKNSAVGGLYEPLMNTAIDLISAPMSDEGASTFRKRVAISAQMINNALPDIMSVDDVRFNEDTGDIEATEPQTFVGQLAPYVVAGGPAFKFVSGGVRAAGLAGKSASAARVFGTGGVLEQAISDPHKGTLFDVVDTYTNKDQKNAVLNFLASEDDDSEAEKRLKMAFQDVLITGVISGVPMLAGLVRRTGGETGEKFLKGDLKNITREESGGFMVDLISEVKRKSGTRQPAAARRPVEEGFDTVDQVLRDTSHSDTPIGRMAHSIMGYLRHATRSRGWLTENQFRTQQQAVASRRTVLQEAEDIGLRLNNSLKEAALKASDEGVLLENVRGALQGDAKMAKALPTGLRGDVRQGRRLIDRLSKEIGNNPMVDTETRETIMGNVGEYLTRSYRMFEDASYVPSEIAMKDAIEERAEAILKSKGKRHISVNTMDEAMKKAKGEIDSTLGTARLDYSTFRNNIDRINNSTLRRRKVKSPAMRALYGEVTDPSDNLVLAVDKMSQLLYQSRWYDSVERLGKGKYLFEAPEGKFVIPIKGTNSALDVKQVGQTTTGYYTTPEMARALTNETPNLPMWAPFSAIKGLSQKAKTVWSHPTHMKNVIGGFGFRMANGYSPFTENSEAAFKAIRNRIDKGGDKGLQDMYNHFLDLGIINTNVRIGEFRQLIEDGTSKSNVLVDKMLAASDKIQKTGLGNKLSNTNTRLGDVYMGTDDYFKINTFMDYRQTLKEAFPEMADEMLDRQAASVIRDIMPNYDLVPKAIKDLRNLPFGNFAGFSSEMLRTSINIGRLGAKEMASGNPVLRERGIKRLLGFGTMTGGAFAGADLSMEMAGLSSPEQKSAFSESMGREWSPDPIVFARRGEDGTLYGLDMSTLNPYSYVYKPLHDLYLTAEEGAVSEEQVTDVLATGAHRMFNDFLSPFTGEAIAFEPVRMALSGELTPERGETTVDYGKKVLDALWGVVEPGSLSAVRRFNEAAQGKRQEPVGSPRDMAAEIDVNTTGLRWTPIRPVENVIFAASGYSADKRDVVSLQPDYDTTPKRVLDTYRRANEAHYDLQAELHRKVRAAADLGMPVTEILQILQKESGLTEDESESIMFGRYYPPVDLVDLVQNNFTKAFVDDGKDKGRFTMGWLELQQQLARDHMQMAGASLLSFSEDENKGRPRGGVEILRSGGRDE